MFDNLDDPKQQALLAAAFGLLGGSGGKGFRGFAQDAGKAGLLGLNRYAVANEDKRRNTEADARKRMSDLQYQQVQRGMEDQDFARQIAPNYFSQGVQPSTPNDDQGNPMPSSAPKADFMGYGQALAARNPQMGAQFMAMAPKPQQPQYKEVGGRLVRIDGDNVKEAYAPPDKPKDWQDPEWVKTQMALRAAGRPQVTTNVMPPREVFKDSLNLKKDFDSQPEVKGFKEVQTAHDQITTALANPTGANDLTAATKFMKLLDPGSVVRESELAMAMAATGKLDQIQNYANQLAKGHKLNPKQRKEFGEAADALLAASQERYGQTVQQYEGIAGQYNLDSQFIQNAKPRASKGEWSIKRVP